MFSTFPVGGGRVKGFSPSSSGVFSKRRRFRRETFNALSITHLASYIFRETSVDVFKENSVLITSCFAIFVRKTNVLKLIECIQFEVEHPTVKDENWSPYKFAISRFEMFQSNPKLKNRYFLRKII